MIASWGVSPYWASVHWRALGLGMMRTIEEPAQAAALAEACSARSLDARLESLDCCVEGALSFAQRSADARDGQDVAERQRLLASRPDGVARISRAR